VVLSKNIVFFLILEWTLATLLVVRITVFYLDLPSISFPTLNTNVEDFPKRLRTLLDPATLAI